MKSLGRRRCGVVMVLMTLGCQSDGDRLAGNGSEVENGLSGRVYTPDSIPVGGAIVARVPKAYNPFQDTLVLLAKDTTDADGRFAFGAGTAPSDSYNLEVVSASLGMHALLSSLSPDSVILSAPGSLHLEKSRLAATDLYIPGSTLRASVDSEVFAWRSLPTGSFDVLYRGSQGILASDLPIGAHHTTRLPAQILATSRDTYVESSEPGVNTGARQYLRLKSGDQGILLVDFDLDSSSRADTGTLWMTVSDYQMNFEDYSYAASVYGFTAPWVEGTAYRVEDPDDGSTYLESEPGIPWKAGFPATSLDPGSRLDVSFTGVKGGQRKHPFPVSGRILDGLKSGAYTAIAILENTERYNNVDFSSSEGSQPPELHLHAPLLNPVSGIRE